MAARQGERASAAGAVTANELARKDRFLVIGAALMALLLGALDTLVMGAAMATIVADMGGLELYSWVFSVYLLSRAVAISIFGKLADLCSGKHLFGFAIAIFLAGSLVAGFSTSMVQLIIARVLQGAGAGAAFALVYTLLSDFAAPGKRGKMMSIASFVWAWPAFSGRRWAVSSTTTGPGAGSISSTCRWDFFPFWASISISRKPA
ncbi:MAG: MFS transporter [Desulfobacterales bacterium]|jgi:MFS family permease